MVYEATTGRRAARVRVPGRRLVAGAAQAALLFFLVGADCSNKQVGTTFEAQLAAGVTPEVSVRAVGQAAVPTPGGAAQRAVFVQCPKPGGPDTVTVLWYPPAGATALSFSGIQPTNPNGPAPYEFAGAPVTDVADALAPASVTVAYAAPAPPQPLGAQTVVDLFTAVTTAGDRYSASFEDTEGAGAPLAAKSGASSMAGSAGLIAGAQAAGDYPWWAVTQRLQPVADVPLDQTLCQEWADLLQGGAFFIALRFPVSSPDAADARSVPLPLVVPAAAASAPRLELLSTQPAPATVFSAPIELRPERLAFAENNLPQAAGERWLTLAPAAQPAATCPADLSGGWELKADMAFDFGGGTSPCSDCVIQEYLCYEGASSPFFFAESAALGAQSTYQGAGTTCIGPLPLRLVGEPPSPPFTLEGAGLARTSGNSVVKFVHTVRGWLAEGSATTADLTTTSTHGFSWELYSDSALRQPITNPVTISGSAQFDFWAATQLPFGFRGQDSVTIAATSSEPGAAQTWTSDHLWSGGWVPPPPSPELHVAASMILSGKPISVSGTLPDGRYRLAVVPNGAYLPGTCYTGGVVAAQYVEVVEGTLPPTVVWATAMAGSYDVLALAGSCGPPTGEDTLIVTGDGLSAAAGVSVRQTLSRRLRASGPAGP